MKSPRPIAASRFGISIDGVEVATFDNLKVSGAKAFTDTGAGLSKTPFSESANAMHVSAHELTHTIQQGGSAKLHLSNPDNAQAAEFKLRNLAEKTVKLTAKDSKGNLVAELDGKATTGGNDTMQQEWSIVYENIQRVK